MPSLSDFKLMLHGNVAIVVDLDLGNKSATNDIENVIRVVDQAIGLKGMTLIYRDSTKTYSRVRMTARGDFVSFTSLGLCHDLFDALEALKDDSLTSISQ